MWQEKMLQTRLSCTEFVTWLLYISDSILTLSDRLAGPFNAENVILPLDVSISEAIMNFQESGFKVGGFHDFLLEIESLLLFVNKNKPKNSVI